VDYGNCKPDKFAAVTAEHILPASHLPLALIFTPYELMGDLGLVSRLHSWVGCNILTHAPDNQ